MFASQSWERHLRRDKSFFVDVFQGQLRSTVTCSRCSFQSVRFEPFMYLSVPVVNSTSGEITSLESCIEAFLAPEELDNESGWSCTKCRTCPRRLTKKIEIWKTPSLLILHLKRFRFHGARACKLKHLVKAPLDDFHFGRFVSSPTTLPPIFSLHAVIDHSGHDQAGHYTAACYHRKLRAWFRFDDNAVSPIQPKEVSRGSNYVLFYNKHGTPEQPSLVPRQSLTSGLRNEWPHVQDI